MDNLSKITKLLVFILATFALFHFGSSFLVPFLFGIFLANIMAPFCNILETYKISRLVASLLSTLVVFIVAGGILFLFAFQVDQFISDISVIQKEMQSFINTLEEKVASIANFSIEQLQNYWQDRSDQIIGRIETYVTNFFSGVLNAFTGFLLVLIYLFLLLLYRNRLSEFIMMYTSAEKKERVKSILNKSTKIVFHYLWGRIKVMSILAVMYYITFLIFDLPYAILITIFGAIITVIPYLGPLISGIIPILFSFIFFDSIPKSILFSAFIIIEQLIESYVLEPWIIGKEVELNPLIVIVAVIIGGMIWGLAGMVLFVPLFAMIKIISSNSKGLEPIGFLLGNSEKKSQEK
ncbi:MAG: AI-2E family transporter [Bacteroidota bacterium]